MPENEEAAQAESGAQNAHDLQLPGESCVHVCTTVGVDDPGLHEAHSQVVKDGGFVQVAERRQVVLAHQDVWVPQRGQLWFVWVHRVEELLGRGV